MVDEDPTESESLSTSVPCVEGDCSSDSCS